MTLSAFGLEYDNYQRRNQFDLKAIYWFHSSHAYPYWSVFHLHSSFCGVLPFGQFRPTLTPMDVSGERSTRCVGVFIWGSGVIFPCFGCWIFSSEMGLGGQKLHSVFFIFTMLQASKCSELDSSSQDTLDTLTVIWKMINTTALRPTANIMND